MEKPKMNKKLGIVEIIEEERVIYFCATPEIALDFREFGALDFQTDRYRLFVDARYDFHNVLEYIRSKNL